ncbi:uroporphyrinogen-III synthase [Candidatus Nitrosacidococcus tergens]|uniref:Uroporphyrinogen-III synthase n=1 Tax=Candidatus Nitrosacidococcus tergens TaxID=553981 RepID=A0A7G1QCA8_9GAMM|nr:uroporphyrinogen-III synthase [Candidatus Nitrosacidococcus tergens]CAB1277610.1 Uroporphyrinogen III synthase HEM4 [Candidatus Nitrosacidococcus tergens]
MVASSDQRLAGQRILVTRPMGQAENLCRLIEKEGGCSLHFPMIRIIKSESYPEVNEIIQSLDTFHWAIFVSVNAVKYGIPLILEQRNFPKNLKIAVVGRGTAKTLAAFNLFISLCPSTGYNSEALLAMDEFQDMVGKKIIIFRGNGGRNLLAKTLADRGAQVSFGEVYRRCLPLPTVLKTLHQTLISNPADIIVTTSQEILENLCTVVATSLLEKLYTTPLVVIGIRQAQRAKELGFTKIYPVDKPEDNALITAMIRCRA